MKQNAIAIITLSLCWKSTALTAAEPQDLSILRDSYQRALSRAISPIQEKYLAEMQKLKLRYTKDGKLEDAITVEKEITKLLAETKTSPNNPESPVPAEAAGPTDHLIGDWYCNNVPHDIYKIKANKRAQHSVDTGTWKADEKEMTIKWANGWRTVIDITQTGEVIHAKNYSPGAADYSLIKFTRVEEDDEE